jgi:hypothetical protein
VIQHDAVCRHFLHNRAYESAGTHSPVIRRLLPSEASTGAPLRWYRPCRPSVALRVYTAGKRGACQPLCADIARMTPNRRLRWCRDCTTAFGRELTHRVLPVGLSCLHGRQRRIFMGASAMWPTQRRIRRRRGLQSALLYRGVEDAGIAGADFSFSGADLFSRVNATGNAGHGLTVCAGQIGRPCKRRAARHLVARHAHLTSNPTGPAPVQNLSAPSPAMMRPIRRPAKQAYKRPFPSRGVVQLRGRNVSVCPDIAASDIVASCAKGLERRDDLHSKGRSSARLQRIADDHSGNPSFE